jgi:thymidine kinase
MNSIGYLELIIGPMYAGKSTELLRIINRYKCLGKNITVVNHILNNRYGSSNLTTHNKEKYDNCVNLTRLCLLKDEKIYNFNQIDVIIVEELQFFPDAFDVIVDWCDNHNKIVIVAGLDGDFMRNPFGDVLKLIPHADKVTKLNALCKKCGDGTLAHFTKRKIKNDELTLIGSDAVYEAVCRKHFLEN